MADVCLITVLLAACVLGCGLTRTLWLHIRHRRIGLQQEQQLRDLPLPPEAELPAIIVQIPIFNEGALIWRVLAAVAALDWPRDRLHVQVLDDSTDDSAEIARNAVREYERRGLCVTLIQRDGRTGFKAGALKAGLACSSEPFVAVFDADYVPRPDFLRLCMLPLLTDPGLAFVQARCDFLNGTENWITRAQQMILDSHFGVEQATRSWSGHVLPFNGTCGIWRRAAIEAAGGWHGDTLTEDLDLSYRAQLAGWRATHLVSVAVPGELPATLRAWQRQQLRWNKGFAQTARKLLPVIWQGDFTWKRKIESVIHLGGCVYGVISVAEVVFWITDAALGTIFYPVVLPLAGFALVQAVIAGVVLDILSRELLRRTKPGWRQNYMTSATMLVMHFYSGVTTASGVIQGLCGRHASFERTPKTGDFQGQLAKEGSVARSGG
jgi:cellulose synthase/poly-beta-1,6-N-acetylglucosamine synthase-like glycosyltransferase